ncbi:MAG: hypothetical protein IJV35_08305 [Neisseriaceae bacterium]|nr:hypothetical protein [Neisseriaceae bacterium]
MSLFVIGYPESIFKFALSGSFKNAFRRLPRRAFGTARNDDFIFRQPENIIKWYNPQPFLTYSCFIRAFIMETDSCSFYIINQHIKQ